MYTKIITAEKLIDLVMTPWPRSYVIFDTRFKLDDPAYGQQSFYREHIPGAFYLDLDRDLSSPITARSGRHPLPDVARFTDTMRYYGVSNETQVFVYDDAGGMFAARLWWLLKWLGHDAVAVLDGGWPAWKKHDGPITEDHDTLPPRGDFTPRPRRELVLTVDEVVEGLASKTITLCDARAPERYRGDIEPMDAVAGHVPGAINVPFIQNLDNDKCFNTPEILRSLHASTAMDNVVHMCGSGVTACHNVLAYAIAGLPLPKLYAGSWSEWIRDPARGVAVGG